ncbi:unnamed protein product [Gongylonema pulchrum]|uniref:Copine domain-containing protein n=1 Tax=Gongylonema pulchrum TaxID=637853 RepID=A0A183ERG7_9BILA|nr:unnamed protein product [Gongylonema pulchrum]
MLAYFLLLHCIGFNGSWAFCLGSGADIPIPDQKGGRSYFQDNYNVSVVIELCTAVDVTPLPENLSAPKEEDSDKTKDKRDDDRDMKTLDEVMRESKKQSDEL